MHIRFSLVVLFSALICHASIDSAGSVSATSPIQSICKKIDSQIVSAKIQQYERIIDNDVRYFSNMSTIITILLGFLGGLSILIPLVTYFWAILPSTKLVKEHQELEKKVEKLFSDHKKNLEILEKNFLWSTDQVFGMLYHAQGNILLPKNKTGAIDSYIKALRFHAKSSNNPDFRSLFDHLLNICLPSLSKDEFEVLSKEENNIDSIISFFTENNVNQKYEYEIKRLAEIQKAIKSKYGML